MGIVRNDVEIITYILQHIQIDITCIYTMNKHKHTEDTLVENINNPEI